MKKLHLLLLVFLSGATCFAQSSNVDRWMIQADATSISNEHGYATSVTAGYIVDARSRYRVDLHVNYSFLSQMQDRQIVSLNFAVSDDFNWIANKIFTNSSIGLGLMTNTLASKSFQNEASYSDLIIPINVVTGYTITDQLSIGVVLNNYLNCANLKERSQYCAGIFMAYRL